MQLTFLAKTTICLLAAGLLMQANAFSYVWIWGTGDWSDPENWDGSGELPNLERESAAIFNGRTAQITGTAGASGISIAGVRNSTGGLEILAGGTLSLGYLDMARMNGSNARVPQKAANSRAITKPHSIDIRP